MVFPYRVKFNGIVYPVGSDVPMDKVEVKEDKATPKEEVAKTSYSYTRSDIQKMTRDVAEPLAKEIGVKNTEGKRLIDIKKAMIEKLGI